MATAEVTRDELTRYFGDLRVRLESVSEAGAAMDRRLARGFSSLEFLRMTEPRLSRIIAWMLDPTASHGQDDAFLRLFLSRLERPELEVASSTARVRLEAPTSRLSRLRRVDILLTVGAFGIGVENKPWAGESHDQLQDYATHLESMFGDRWMLLYLGRSGRMPTSLGDRHDILCEEGRFRALNYEQDIIDWVGLCARECEAPKVGDFLEDFKARLRTEFSEVVL